MFLRPPNNRKKNLCARTSFHALSRSEQHAPYIFQPYTIALIANFYKRKINTPKNKCKKIHVSSPNILPSRTTKKPSEFIYVPSFPVDAWIRVHYNIHACKNRARVKQIRKQNARVENLGIAKYITFRERPPQKARKRGLIGRARR